MSHFFNGSHVTKLDEKGRIVLPQAMRYGLIESGKLEFTVGLGLGGCLAIYRNSEIEKIVEHFQKKQHVVKYQKFFTIFFSTLHQTTCDKLGRFSIPQILRKASGIEGEVVVAGVLNKIEIWPREKYELELLSFLDGGENAEALKQQAEEAFALLEEMAKPAAEEELALEDL